MATYVMLFRYTEKGIENVKQSPSRVNAVKEAFRKLGAEVKDFYLLMGRYDTMIIAEAPNDEVMATAALALGSMGNVRSETLRAFSEDEFRRIVGAIP